MQYVDAFRQLAKKTNTVLLPANAGDPASMIAQVCSCDFACILRAIFSPALQAMSIFKNVNGATPAPTATSDESIPEPRLPLNFTSPDAPKK